MKGKGLIAVFEGLPVLLLIEHCKNQGRYMGIKIPNMVNSQLNSPPSK